MFIQRFGSLLNAHTHLHLIVLDGLCQDNPQGGVRFMPADPLDQDAVLGVQQAIRVKLLDYAASRGFLEPDEARDMLAWAHGELCDAFCAPPSTLTPPASDSQPDPAPASTAPWRWATLLARLFECFLLICLHCNSPMRIISFITDPIPVKAILSRLDLPISAPRPSPARGPPEIPHPGSTVNQDPEQHQSFDPNAQPAPPFQFDQRIDW